eukprot:Rhum_TRINITY_DN3175_c0_g1::Rhum_TRINITY_DN3175_c0_g1_i1::g.9865::m.9865
MMETGEVNYSLKLLLVGDSLVGKSCLITRYADDCFEANFIATIGVDFKVKTVDVGDGKLAKLQIWDTAGQERFSNITRSYYRGSDAILIVYDVTNRDSFTHVSKWMRELQEHSEETSVRILVGNKADLAERRVVSSEEGARAAAAASMQFFETSALTGANVSEAFMSASMQCRKEYDERGGPRPLPQAVKLETRSAKSSGKKCSC